MDTPCFITGTGLVTVQGLDVAENWANLLAGRVLRGTGIVPLPCDPSLPRVSQLAIHAAHEAHAAAGGPSLNNARTALVIGTSKGPVEDWLDALDGRRQPDLTQGVARVATDVAAALGHARGPRLTMAGACASGLLALIRAVDLIRQGTCDQALVVAAEASTHALFEANFRRLGVIATPEAGCRPFDTARRGFFLAEAAAAVALSRVPGPSAIAVGRTAWLSDAHHLTAPDPAATTLMHALSALRLEAVDLVHAHGTGTVQNDAAELFAIDRVCGVCRPAVYSHKHTVGHTQGVSGLIGVVVNTQSHTAGIVPGNSNTDRPISALSAIDSRHAHRRPIRESAIISAGFGGTVATLCMKTKPQA